MNNWPITMEQNHYRREELRRAAAHDKPAREVRSAHPKIIRWLRTPGQAA